MFPCNADSNGISGAIAVDHTAEPRHLPRDQIPLAIHAVGGARRARTISCSRGSEQEEWNPSRSRDAQARG